MEAARVSELGRPRKYDEETRKLSVMLPMSLRDYLDEVNKASATDALLEIIEFHKDIKRLVKASLTEFRVSAAHSGFSFEDDTAETLVRLAKLGLAVENLATPSEGVGVPEKRPKK